VSIVHTKFAIEVKLVQHVILLKGWRGLESGIIYLVFYSRLQATLIKVNYDSESFVRSYSLVLTCFSP
jgi:hypothetical protein